MLLKTDSKENIASLSKTNSKKVIASLLKTDSKKVITSYSETDSKEEKNEKSNVNPQKYAAKEALDEDENDKPELLQILKNSRYDYCTENINFSKYFNQ